MKSRLVPVVLAAAAALAWASAAMAHSAPSDSVFSPPPTRPLVEVQVIDRASGEPVAVYLHAGKRYLAGSPSARYAIRLVNRTGERLLNVVSVDGINVVTGETAAPGQNGYVYGPWQRHDIAGWRKSTSEIAAFHFTTLPDSYAARTDRPSDIGVIGIAVFRERRPPPAPPVISTAPAQRGDEARAFAADRGEQGPTAAAPSAAAPTSPAADRRADAAAASKSTARERIGTGHGEREHSSVAYTRFTRDGLSPAQVVTLYYDRLENLVARGIVPMLPPLAGEPRPFPRAGGFVPDPRR